MAVAEILPAVGLQAAAVAVDTTGVDTSHISSAAGQTVRREMTTLARLLKSGEQMLDMCHGIVDGGRTGVLVLTDRRVVYLQRRRLWGAHVESIPLADLRSAEDQIGIRHATVKVDAGGRVFELFEVDRALAKMFCSRVQSALARS